MSAPTKISKPDRNKIELGRTDEMKYWIKHFEVTAEELHRAVERVGNSASAVRKELAKATPRTNPKEETS